jgi:hypothetical protein
MAQVVHNGSFEAGFESWSRIPNDDSHARISDSGPHKGERCLEFRWRDTPASRVYVEQSFDTPLFSLGPTHLAFWLRTERYPSAPIEVELYFESGVVDSCVFSAELDWTQNTMPVRTFAGLEKIRFIPQTSMRLYVDDVSLHSRGLREIADVGRFFDPSSRFRPPGGPGSFPGMDASAAMNFVATQIIEERLLGLEHKLQGVITALAQLRPNQDQKPNEVAAPRLAGERKKS